MVHHFHYRNARLCAEDVDIATLADDVGTPFYCYSSATLRRHYRVLCEAFGALDHMICYSVKANSNQSVIATLVQAGAGVDVVSQGELQRALAAGARADRIVFSGVGKRGDEMRAALEAQIYCFNVESAAELETLDRIATQMGVQAPVSIRINPDVDAQTHAKITTGRAENKFGVAFSQVRNMYRRAAALSGIDVRGIDMHIGSQVSELAPFDDAFARLREMVLLLRNDGHTITHVNLGGGLGIPYGPCDDDDTPMPPSPLDYMNCVRRHVADLGCRVIIEPGRVIAGNAGILVTRVIALKEGEGKTFVIVDGAMNDLIRPTLYDAHHEVQPVCRAGGRDAPEARMRADIVGPVCESGDYLALDRQISAVRTGDLLAIMSAGAYGAVLASTYNSRPLVPEVLVDGERFAIVRPRPSVQALIDLDRMAPWLQP